MRNKVKKKVWRKDALPARRARSGFHEKTAKNVHYKKKSRQMVEQHRKQTQAELAYRQMKSIKTNSEHQLLELLDDINQGHEEESQAFDDLLFRLSSKYKKVAINEKKSQDRSKTSTLIFKVEHEQPAVALNEIDDGVEESLKEPRVKNDSFTVHLNFELKTEEIDGLYASGASVQTNTFSSPNLGNLVVQVPALMNYSFNPSELLRNTATGWDPNAIVAMGLKSSIKCKPMTPLQMETWTLINQYCDFYYPTRAREDSEAMTWVYCMHILNHILKTRSSILHHNAKLRSAENSPIIPDSFRDQGLSRPKVLVLLPFRKSAYQLVDNLAQLLFGKGIEALKSDGKIVNISRFIEAYTGDSLQFSTKKPKPNDYNTTFSGNIDDNFKIGISLTKKTLKLYADFNASDIIVASPLGLRMSVGAGSGVERSYDFLNSIEILVIDQAEIFLAQNWENVMLVIDHLHLQPQSLQNVDLQRVRTWCINGLSRFYRQTIILASHELPELRSVYNNKCLNFAGKMQVSNPVVDGDIRKVFVTVPQAFRFIDAPSLDSLLDMRFRYFIQEILPHYKNLLYAHCMIYVPNYLDFVRLRNYFKSEGISFAQICEYSEDRKVTRARDLFFHSGVHFLLYSERFHFFRRTRIKGIRHMIMYQPPLWPQFYSEMINMMNNNNQNINDGLEDSMSVTVLYTKYDTMLLNNVLGCSMASNLLNSEKNVSVLSIK